MAKTSTEVRSESLEKGSIKPSPAPENVRWAGPDLTGATEYIQSFARKVDRRLGVHRHSMGTTERVPSPEISDEAYSRPLDTFKEGAD